MPQSLLVLHSTLGLLPNFSMQDLVIATGSISAGIGEDLIRDAMRHTVTNTMM